MYALISIPDSQIQQIIDKEQITASIIREKIAEGIMIPGATIAQIYFNGEPIEEIISEAISISEINAAGLGIINRGNTLGGVASRGNFIGEPEIIDSPTV